MKLLSKLFITLLMIPMAVNAHGDEWKYTKEKTLKKEYTVNRDAGLKVDNSYGNIDIVTWNENRTVIEVHITTRGDDEETVQKRLDEIDVEFSASSSLVSARTEFGKNNKNSWSVWGKKKSVSMEVNYTIKLPVNNSVDLSNDYGSISLNKLQGNAKINCDYGQLIIGELMAEDNYLNFDYTNNSTISYMKSGRINADYSGFVLDKVGRLELNADYSNSEIGEVNDLNYNCDYGKIMVNSVTNLTGRGDYLPHKIGTVKGSLNLNTDYGSIAVDRLSPGTRSATIKSSYTSIKLGFDSNLSFNFEVRMSYAGFSGEDNVTVTKSDKESTSSYYEGYHKSRNSGNTVSINANYGSVSFKKQ